MTTQGIGNKIAIGAAWMALFKLLDRSLGLISVVILARLLSPEDFGIVAMAMALIAMLELLGAFSFDMAIIQNRQAQRRHFDTAWTLTVLVGIIIAALLLILAGPAARFYRNDAIADVVKFLAIGAAIQGIANIGVVEFRRQLDFRKEFIYLFSRKLAMFCVTIPLAFILKNYWALVFGQVAGKAAGTILSYLLHTYRPRPSLKAGRELFSFSGWLMVNNLLFYLKNRAVELIIGRMLGTRSLGVFSISYEISNLPTTEVIGPVNRAVYPGYSKLSGELALLRREFTRIIGIIALVAMPVGAGIAAMSEYIVLVLLGDQWLDAIPLISILAIFGTIGALQSNTTYIFLALGKPRIETYLGIAYVVILLGLLALLIPRLGTTGVAYSYLLTVIVMTPPTLMQVRAQLHLTWSKFAEAFWRPLIASTLMFLTVKYWLSYVQVICPGGGIPVEMSTGIVVGIGAYCGIVLLLWLLAGKPETSAESLFIRFASARFSRTVAGSQD